MAPAHPAHPPADKGSSQTVYFDGRSNRKRSVTLAFGPELAIMENGVQLAAWAYADIRRLHASEGLMRLRATTAPELARLELYDPALQGAITTACPFVDGGDRERSIKPILLWSMAAASSIAGLIWFGVPYAADRLAPLIPVSWEKHLGEAVDKRVLPMFQGKACRSSKGAQALAILSGRLQSAAQLDSPATIEVISSKVPNAIALPGGKIYLFSELLAKSESQDEIAGVLAHELGHLHHRDHLRRLIADGGAAYLFGLLFGDVTGAGALIFAGKSLFNASYSREAESAADEFAAQTMQSLGRSPKAMGSLLLRVTGPERDGVFTIIHDHPMSEDRLERLSRLDKGATGLDLLSAAEWKALKTICD